MTRTRRQVHTLTPFAKVRGLTVTYPLTATKASASRFVSPKTMKIN